MSVAYARADFCTVCLEAFRRCCPRERTETILDGMCCECRGGVHTEQKIAYETRTPRIDYL